MVTLESLKCCWEIIKEDLKLAVQYFYNQHGQHFNLLNSAHIVLSPKTAEAKKIGDFRPISLTSSVVKIISKMLAQRLSKFLNELVSRNQSAFIKRCNIHDNFMYTENLIKELHRAKRPTLFLKLDIAKAFDTVRWDYLMEVLQIMGFGARWRGWMSTLLSIATLSIMVNGLKTRKIENRTGLGQGDPISNVIHYSTRTITEAIATR